MRDLHALEQLLRQRQAQPFLWGERDCATLVFDALCALTGTDPGAGIRGRWSNARQAARVLHELGGWPGLARRFGPQVPVAETDDGDVLLLLRSQCVDTLARRGALALRWRGWAIAQGATQLVAAPLGSAGAAWRAA